MHRVFRRNLYENNKQIKTYKMEPTTIVDTVTFLLCFDADDLI